MSSFVAVPTTKQDRPTSAITPSKRRGSMRSRPGSGSLRGFSSKPFTDVPRGAEVIERSATLLRGRPGRGRGLRGAGVLLLDVQEDRQDLARGGRRGLGAEAAGLERSDHDVARIRVRRERGVPGLVGAPDALLRGAGLAR